MIFLPYPDLKKSAASLDNFRLNHQRRVAKQIILFLTNKLGPESDHLGNHPAVKMWRGHVDVLKNYHDILIDEWVSRGKKNTMDRMLKVTKEIPKSKLPWWLGKEKFHRAQRSVLYNKWPEYYRSSFKTDDHNYNDGNYWWPINKTKEFIKINPKVKSIKKKG